MFPQGDLQATRRAFDEGAWSTAHESFTQAELASPLAAPDLERWAQSAYLLGRPELFTRLLDRAHQAYLIAGDVERAAYCVCWLGVTLFGTGARSQAGGWLAIARRLLAGAQPGGRVHGYLALADALQAVAAGDMVQATVSGERAVDIADAHNDPDLAALALQLTGRVLLRSSRTRQGYALLDEAMVVVSTRKLRPDVAGIVYCSVIDGCRAGYALGRAREWTEVLSRMCEEQAELVAFTGECRVARAEMCVLQGAWQEALEEAASALVGLAPWSRRKVVSGAHYQRAEVLRLRGNLTGAEEAYEAAGMEGGQRQPGLALLRLAQGRHEAAAQGLNRVLEETEKPLDRARYLPARVATLLRQRDPDLATARQAAEELSDLAGVYGTAALAAMAAHAMGEVELATGNAQNASRLLQAAVGGWSDLNAPYEVARARLCLAEAYAGLGDVESAELERNTAERVLKDLGAALDQVHLAPPVNVGSAGSLLSKRELQVLDLLVAGETNRAIGVHLAISQRTVDRHVSNIFDKLGTSSRTETVAYALQQHLI